MTDETTTLEGRVKDLDEQINGMILLVASLTQELIEGDAERRERMKRRMVNALGIMSERGYSVSTQLPARTLLEFLEAHDISLPLLH